MKLNKTKYIGIDIGGAHLKCIGIDKNKNITYTKYFSYEMWVDKNSLKEKLHIINNDMKDIDACVGITMSAELCDSFKSRRIGGQFIVKACEILNFKKFFYSNHLEAFRPKIVLDEIMSMNWHSIGRLCEKKIKNCLIIDFGSTTTDFLCIKNFKFQNKYFDDFSRLNNNEMIYSGLIRTPLFGLKKNVSLKKKSYQIIPEIFAHMSDIYRVLGLIKNNTDIGNTADGSNKSIINSFRRISRNFGFDYNKSKKNLILEISKKFYLCQLDEIEKNILVLKKKYRLGKNMKIMLSGIGQTVLKNYLMKKKYNVDYLYNFLNKGSYRFASLHAPALSIALLLSEKK